MPYRLDNDALFANHGSHKLKAAKHGLWSLVADIERQVRENPSAETERWLSAIDLIRTQDQEPVTRIGVRGATGCGKTTAINAICGIQNMMPTDSSKSTTAVVTELHHHDRPGFHVEVEYVSEEEWTDIIIGVKSLLEDEKNVMKLAREDSDAESAMRLLLDVYHKFVLKDLQARSLEDFLN